MKVVALISGGKDSCYNMMHCIANGHPIVALANLYPLTGDEIDSWMYQTVGHDVISLYEEAIGVPLYRKAIQGSNIEQGLGYEEALGDETEDMYQLLSDVLEAHPDVQAVSVGAIASNYQRLRVENIAARLGLTVLAYLWERDQLELLQEMSSRVEAILIKVACVGLTHKHLGKTLQDMQPLLLRLHDKYEVHPCGEGGEYETIVLDCPLFNRKLSVTYQEVVKLEGDTAYLRLQATLQEKAQMTMKLPASICPTFNGIWKDNPPLSTKQSNVQCKQMTFPCKPSNEVIFCQLLLPSMADFSSINIEYAKLWSGHPPARVCIASPSSSEITLNTISLPHTRKLWVQSVSYWAPANIGPYSQAAIGDVAFISGQIGLIPHTMRLAETIEDEINWSLRSLQNIIISQKLQDWSGVVIAYTLLDNAERLRRAFAALPYDLTLLIVQMLPGSELPRGANIEWQYIAGDVAFGETGCINFSTTPSQAEWTLHVHKIIYNTELDHCGIIIRA